MGWMTGPAGTQVMGWVSGGTVCPPIEYPSMDDTLRRLVAEAVEEAFREQRARDEMAARDKRRKKRKKRR